LLVAACGSPTPGAAISNRAAAGTKRPEAPRPPGTSGFPGLDWRITESQLRRAIPGLRPYLDRGLEWSVRLDHAGWPGLAIFEVVDDALSHIAIGFDGEFSSMEDCAPRFAKVRAEIDKQLGTSSLENLAAYWSSPTYEVQLSCDIAVEDGAAALSMMYDPPAR
jgi:hypothetical protein